MAVAVAAAAGAGYWFARMEHGAAPPAGAGPAAAALEGEREILYYRNPMGLPDISPVPKKDSMGMDYIPVHAGDEPADGGAVVVSPARIQTLGVKTAAVEVRAVEANVRASGRVEIDERTQVVVAPRFGGWVERLHVSAVGDPVRKGQPLFTAYSPELQSGGEELRIAERLASRSAAHDALAGESARRLAEAARARLRNLEVAGQDGARQVLHAPAGGVVLEKMAVEGGRFMAGEALFRIADLSRVWIVADIHEQDLARVRPGQSAQVTLDAHPGRSFEARVAYLYPTLDAATRSTRVRLELANPEGALRPGMFARVVLAAGDARAQAVVPVSAVIDDGERQVVLRALGDGRFRPQPVRLGQRGRDVVEVLEGVAAGDRVVVAANFLIDSESQLRAALASLAEPAGGGVVAHEVDGTFEAVDVAAGSLTLSHGEIPALKWPAMTMDFMIADPSQVKDIAPGTPVRFVFHAGAPGEYIVTAIEPLAGERGGTGAGTRGGHGGH